MPEIELSVGTIGYEDTGGSGPVIVLLHGLLMDGTQWRKVVSELSPDFRCVLPTLPMGARIVSRCTPMRTSRYGAWGGSSPNSWSDSIFAT